VGSIVAMTRRREKSKKKGDLNLESKWDFGRSMIRMATKFTFSIAKHDLEQFVRMDLEQRQLAEELDLIMEESHSVLRKHHEQNRRNRQVHERWKASWTPQVEGEVKAQPQDIWLLAWRRTPQGSNKFNWQKQVALKLPKRYLKLMEISLSTTKQYEKSFKKIEKDVKEKYSKMESILLSQKRKLLVSSKLIEVSHVRQSIESMSSLSENNNVSKEVK
jgi:hypothetical protein